MVRNFALYRAALALALQPRLSRPVRDILRERRCFKKRPCQSCGRTFQPRGRWNCRCEQCRTLQDEEGVPPRVFAEPREPEKRKRSPV